MIAERQIFKSGVNLATDEPYQNFKPLKILLINDTDSRENIGCRLTSRMLKKNISDSFARHGFNVNIVPAPWRFGKSVGASMTLRLLIGDSQRPSINGLRALAKREYGNTIVKELDSYDFFFFQPEGTINDWDHSLRIIRFLSLPLLCASANLAPLTVINGTFPLFNDSRFGLITSLLKDAHLKSARDRLSSFHYGIDFIPDAACSWIGKKQIRPFAERKYILITTSAKLTKAENIKLAQLAIYHGKQRGLRPLVLTKQWQDLISIRDDILSLGGSFRYYEELSDAAEMLSQCRLHIGGRYHMAILSACVDVPSILVGSNSDKNTWLANECSGIYLSNDTHNLQDLIGKLLLQHKERDVYTAIRNLGAMHLKFTQRMVEDLIEHSLTLETKPASPQPDLSKIAPFWPGRIRSILWPLLASRERPRRD